MTNSEQEGLGSFIPMPPSAVTIFDCYIHAFWLLTVSEKASEIAPECLCCHCIIDLSVLQNLTNLNLIGILDVVKRYKTLD